MLPVSTDLNPAGQERHSYSSSSFSSPSLFHAAIWPRLLSSKYFPGTHGPQAGLPSSDVYLPGSQNSHLLKSDRSEPDRYCPRLQSWHGVLNFPPGQGTQTADPLIEVLPVLQSWHSVCSITSV